MPEGVVAESFFCVFLEEAVVGAGGFLPEGVVVVAGFFSCVGFTLCCAKRIEKGRTGQMNNRQKILSQKFLIKSFFNLNIFSQTTKKIGLFVFSHSFCLILFSHLLLYVGGDSGIAGKLHAKFPLALCG